MAVVTAPFGQMGRTTLARYFGTGDGSRVLFNLAGMDSGRAYLMPVLFKQDWGGIQQLYSTARTNNCFPSENYNNVSWGIQGGIVSVNNAEIIGLLAFTRLSGPNGAACFRMTTFPVDGVNSVSLFVKMDGLNSGVFNVKVFDSTAGWLSRLEANITIAADGSITAAAIIGSVESVVSLGGGVYRVALKTVGIISANSNSVYLYDVSSTATIASALVSGVQVSNVLSSYISTTTAPVTVTDYSVDTTGKVTTSPALPTGTILSYRDPHAPGGNVYRAFGMGDGVSTDFSLPFVPFLESITDDNIVLVPTTDYSLVPNGDITFVVAPVLGHILRRSDGDYDGIGSIYVNSDYVDSTYVE